MTPLRILLSRALLPAALAIAAPSSAYYLLANGPRGIAVAVVPEPATAAGGAAAGAALLGLGALRTSRRASKS